MKYEVKRYQDAQGKVPFTDWITKLRKKQRQAAAKIDIQIDRASAGNFGDYKAVREGVLEMKIDFGPGYRIYYAIDGKKIIILLYGGDKDKQDSDIDKAVKYLRDYKARKQNDEDRK
ncbi:TPA: type II toxin-antitoxin system RelE/ParE family toxin [Yersinia enterocolitica]|uniref:type II toxin-antitoxin system RelE/ParE family toxin n=1 Tax=Yersinia TaxID=629 RepID=UPI00119DCF05|nr:MULTISPECIES: type II toxin-antitoxin system RelE/ParE family toxin [Yersinia]EKN3442196.1 type II toxin-antitoxin system RelE/ParE family toxin [Yersinia enterocolitica]EKN3597340.1 type II toxin-antitoxin system RelE/ParE family toxin [Yersinia enterocolitica]EKN3725423.1 type II toxin-antitoxin system RelE/ParE family toxin [Yersinia enterocolitica]EKN3939897.1 type II toxin-antitoxin system RelE/ParE family toxin [Yersinia enterocolitica]EKN3986335.1 type II toxin-antitoxin system RelE/